MHCSLSAEYIERLFPGKMGLIAGYPAKALVTINPPSFTHNQCRCLRVPKTFAVILFTIKIGLIRLKFRMESKARWVYHGKGRGVSWRRFKSFLEFHC